MANASGNNNSLLSQEKKQTPVNPIKSLLDSPAVKKRFEQILERRAPQFTSSIINLVNSDTNLSKCEPMTVLGSCMVAATLDLPVDKSLGYMYIVPYGARAQAIIGYKGYIQLALRTGQYKYINVVEVCEGELIKFDKLTEEIIIDFDKRTSDVVVGYAAYFELLNGFRKTVYWTRPQVEAHKKRFSKAAGNGPWVSDFDAMAKKTVLKSMLSRWGILSIEMQKAVTDDDQVHTVNQSGDDMIDVDYTIIDDSQSENDAD